jgi:beta-glucanase (GH16 family)
MKTMKHFFQLLLATIFCAVISSHVETAEPIPPLEKPGWKLTFHDEFDRPKLDDHYWFSSYRAGRKIWFKQKGIPSRWADPNAHYVLENGILKLRIDEKFPTRTEKSIRCVSSIQTSDHRYGETENDFQVLDKFAQKYGWFEVRCKIPEGGGLHSAFWLLQTDPTKQEYTPENRRRKLGEGIVEIDIFEQLGTKTKTGVIDFNVHFTNNGGCEYKLGFDPSKDFHVYALEWKEGELNWYVDGQKAKTYLGETPQLKMFILLGLYQGAVPDWTGPTDPNMHYPRDFEIDYVRVYSKK